MYNNNFEPNKFEEIFPHVENILQCGIYVNDVINSEIKWSRGMYLLFGLEPFSIEPKHDVFLQYVCDADLPDVITAIKESKTYKKPYKIEFCITDAIGTEKRMCAENYLVYSKTGELKEYNGIIKDVTQNYLYKQQLEQKIEELNKSNQSLQEFVYVASHDLQEPLRKVTTFVERLNAKYGSTFKDDAKLFVDKISKSTRSMQTLLEDLLSFSKLSATDKKPEKVFINEIINSVLADLELTIEEHKCKIECDKTPEIEAYPSQIRQLFTNLITNSIKFKREGLIPEIKIKCDEVTSKDYPMFPLLLNEKYVKITVTDNGIGFEQNYSEKIFQIFQRLHGKAQYSGSGIGLSICKKIMDNHHGYIFANGDLNKGATFTLLFPKTQST